jgi:hypothetical protein
MSQVVNFAGLVPLPECQDDNEAMHIFQMLTRPARHGSFENLNLDRR